MRDYYCFIKQLRIHVNKTSTNVNVSPSLLTEVVGRNFGGSEELSKFALDTFQSTCFTQDQHPEPVPVRSLIRANLSDKSARHLMILTANGAALPILFGSGLITERESTVLIGSEFKEDASELHLIQQINEVKTAMATGSTIVLLNHDQIYEALYDVLNQRFLTMTDSATGKVEKRLRLAIGARSDLCYVADGFRIIVVVEQSHAYHNLDLPLLNRFVHILPNVFFRYCSFTCIVLHCPCQIQFLG